MRLPKLFDDAAREKPLDYAKGKLKHKFQQGYEVATGGGLQADPISGQRYFGLMPWENSAKEFGVPDTNWRDPIVENAAYGAGRLAGSFMNDSMRSWYWRFNHPLGIANSLGREIPRKAGLVNHKGKVLPGAAVAAAFGVTTALDLASGNTDITNLDEGGRPKGYSALFASPEDPTKSTNLAVEVPVGYLTGRKGKLLPWETFSQERPDVTPEEYQEYKTYQGFNTPGLLGLERADPMVTGAVGATLSALPVALNKDQKPTAGRLARRAGIGAVLGTAAPAAAELVSRMGILKGTWDNLEDQPEVQLSGYKVPLSGALVAGGVGAGIYAAQKGIAKRLRNNYEAEEASLKKLRLQNEMNAANELRKELPEFMVEVQSLSPAARIAVENEIDRSYKSARRDFEKKISRLPTPRQKKEWAKFDENPLGWVEGVDPDIQRRIIHDATTRTAKRQADDYLAAERARRPVTFSDEDLARIEKVKQLWNKRTGAYQPPDVFDPQDYL